MTAYKVVRFLDGEPSQAEALRARWTRVLAAAAERAPTTGRPRRVALAVPLELPDLSPPRFAAIDLQWFADARGARANEVWLEAIDPDLCLGSSLFAAGSGQVVAEEVVRRGSEYLDTRWEVGGDRYKMMSFGRRDPRLTLQEFSTRWRDEAGRFGTEEIPAEVRGLAYVQNHPVPLDDGWFLDAVNEVWFERLDDLRRRGAWFAARQEAALRSGAASFMSPTETWSMFVRESPLTPPGW
jgi:hypothetical protein